MNYTFIAGRIGFSFLVLAHSDSPIQRAVKWVCLCTGRIACVTNCCTGLLQIQQWIINLAWENGSFMPNYSRCWSIRSWLSESWKLAHTHLFNGPFSGTTRVSRYQKDKPIWILLKQETVSGSGISKSAPCSRQITTPAPHHSVFYRPDALPAAQPTASKHWRQNHEN